MNRALLFLSCVSVMSMPPVVAAQALPTTMTTPNTPKPMAMPAEPKPIETPTAPTTMATPTEPPQTIKPPVEPALPNSRFMRTNVQVELTLTDQVGVGAPDKKTISLVASSGSWGRVRSAGNVSAAGEVPAVVDLNVDARPNVSADGSIQLELTIVYAPAKTPPNEREPAKVQPIRVNQSMTVNLQSGKPLVISQAADPVSDRKVIVEVKATVLK